MAAHVAREALSRQLLDKLRTQQLITPAEYAQLDPAARSLADTLAALRSQLVDLRAGARVQLPAEGESQPVCTSDRRSMHDDSHRDMHSGRRSTDAVQRTERQDQAAELQALRFRQRSLSAKNIEEKQLLHQVLSTSALQPLD